MSYKKLRLIGIGGLFWYWKSAYVRKLKRGQAIPVMAINLKGSKLQEGFRPLFEQITDIHLGMDVIPLESSDSFSKSLSA